MAIVLLVAVLFGTITLINQLMLWSEFIFSLSHLPSWMGLGCFLLLFSWLMGD
ncbi:MAG TPA: hypothetical protein V6C84_20345 [Coleofasciculaceae cyanobacterium]